MIGGIRNRNWKLFFDGPEPRESGATSMNGNQMTNILSWKRKRPKFNGAIVLARRPGENGLVGLTETSLFMNWSSTRVRFWWTDIISDAALGLQFNVDGRDDAEVHARHCRSMHPTWEITVWDAHDEDLPILID
ncbi:MAG: hypothetical protein E5Y73_05340 [Mesorhizobium sp.]|uniref:hypothetical protein n=1 Tax=Mesorhizobium sp. TaxID=1871066 RepID=UPI0012066B96|nr:hypothetical protein [Mesorhizobium sp.]TIL95672.1 MAG: hypothetical protein E5Y73_05340 [Mesorhizobium sp.]